MKSRSSKPGFLKKLSSHKEFVGLLPITGWQIFFYLVPFAFLMVISFWMTKDYQIISTWNLGNYKAVFTDPLVRIAFFRSLWITLTTLVITILAAYPFAYGLVFKVPKKYRNVILIAIIAPFWTNYLVRVYSWQLIIGGTGVVNHMLSLIGIIDSPLNILYTHTATRIGLLHFLISVMILNLYGTLDNVNKSHIEAANDLGAGPFKRFLWVTFPLSLPGLANGTVFVFIFSFTDFIAPSVLGGGTKPVYSQMVVDAAHWTANYPYASALSIVMLLVIAIFLLIIFMTIKAIVKEL
jgi:spermidine/putrescine transport system permease protein